MYRLGIWLLAVVFVFNGAASFALVETLELPASIAQDHHGHDVIGAKGDAQVRRADKACDDTVAASADHDHARGHAHNGLKCCGVCNFVSLLPAVDGLPVTFSYAAITFRMSQHDLVGHLVGLDPGIPKTVV